ncbi:uncharacterized protein LOC117897005 [Drosophila subobscura]|uniref:uncharacterized protein LOC117897005 n=1 Tax=Drosophila subobscura TaxID=7241 RepID=UPI00155A4ABC|nr:uncharacterized protein LOC117897005 [Drosophila subobscura]
MRFLIALCLVAAASADSLGYNYQPSASTGSSSYAPSAAGPSYNQAASAPAYTQATGGQSYSPAAAATQEQPTYNAPSESYGSAPEAAPSADAPNYSAPQTELQKEFFTYTADESAFNEPAGSEQVSSSLNKALRVIFIKGPENRGLENAALALAKQAGQQETAIYVLNKQADIGDLANKLNSIRSNNNNKPEVHFVKYRTPEDAANAQQAIQGQYDQLGGSSSIQNGGVAPVLNFASQAPARPVAAPSSPENSYLPASVLRHRL